MTLRWAALAFPQLVTICAGSWVYADSGETEANRAAQDRTWGGICTTGKEQSPINVVTANAVKTAIPTITTQFNTNAKADYVKHTGNGFQYYETSPTMSLFNISESDSISEVPNSFGDKGHSIIGGAKYNFYQVHWHAPSENTIDGKFYAAEAHFVHQLDDQALVGTLHRLAVIGLMYELSDECNTFLDKFWDDFPDNTGVGEYKGEALDFNEYISAQLSQGYYHWYGSLTTPPCTEGVSWNLMKVSQKICQRQVDTLRDALAAAQNGINFNNRVVMPLNHRVVADMAPDSPYTPVTTAPAVIGGDWKYAEDNAGQADAQVQFDTWGLECATGKEQSPIDIVTANVKQAQTSPITTNFDAQTTFVKNTGNGFQVFETSPHEHTLDANGNVVKSEEVLGAKGYSTIHNEKWNFYQVHWHTPSENTINGENTIMEAHFVHQLDDVALVGTLHRLAVIGLMYELGTDSECNEWLDKFWDAFPVDKGVAPVTSAATMDLNQVLTDELSGGYYHWYGSLTTPPCTEGVSWNLLRQRQKVCQRQVDRLKAALNTTQAGVSINNRAVMPLNHRVVTETERVTTTEGGDVGFAASSCLSFLAVWVVALLARAF